MKERSAKVGSLYKIWRTEAAKAQNNMQLDPESFKAMTTSEEALKTIRRALQY